MKFERIPAIRACYKPSFAHTHNFHGHLFLGLEIPHMLNHRIAVNSIEIFIWLRQVQSVPKNGFDFRIISLHPRYRFRRDIYCRKSVFPRVRVNKLQATVTIRIYYSTHVKHLRPTGWLHNLIKQLQFTSAAYVRVSCEQIHFSSFFLFFARQLQEVR